MMHVANSLSYLGALSARGVSAWSSRGGTQRAHPWLPSAAPPALIEWTTPLGEWADLIKPFLKHIGHEKPDFSDLCDYRPISTLCKATRPGKDSSLTRAERRLRL